MNDLCLVWPPSWMDIYKYYGQLFEVEYFQPHMIAIWSVFSTKPYIVEADKPFSIYKKFFDIRMSMIGGNTHERSLRSY